MLRRHRRRAQLAALLRRRLRRRARAGSGAAAASHADDSARRAHPDLQQRRAGRRARRTPPPRCPGASSPIAAVDDVAHRVDPAAAAGDARRAPCPSASTPASSIPTPCDPSRRRAVSSACRSRCSQLAPGAGRAAPAAPPTSGSAATRCTQVSPARGAERSPRAAPGRRRRTASARRTSSSAACPRPGPPSAAMSSSSSSIAAGQLLRVQVASIATSDRRSSVAGECILCSGLPSPRYMCTPQGRHGSKLRTARMMSMPLKSSVAALLEDRRVLHRVLVRAGRAVAVADAAVPRRRRVRVVVRDLAAADDHVVATAPRGPPR